MLEIIRDDSNLWDWDFENKKYICKVYANMRTKDKYAYRSLDFDNPGKIIRSTNSFDIEPHELYIQKAKYIYCRIIKEHADDWWD